MGWSLGYDTNWERDIGYGVPAFCDHPGCGKEIDRGLAYVCGGEPYGGDKGCGLYFCGMHLFGYQPQRCDRCGNRPRKRKPHCATFDHPLWIRHKLTHESWQTWRDANPDKVKELTDKIGHTIHEPASVDA